MGGERSGQMDLICNSVSTERFLARLPWSGRDTWMQVRPLRTHSLRPVVPTVAVAVVVFLLLLCMDGGLMWWVGNAAIVHSRRATCGWRTGGWPAMPPRWGAFRT